LTNKHLYKIIITASIITIGCNPSKILTKTELSNYAIIELKEKTYAPIDREFKPAKLSEVEIKMLKEIIQIAISENNIKQLIGLKEYNERNPTENKTETGFELSLENMQIQLVPYFNNIGEKWVWVNVFCEDEYLNFWREDIVVVEDGGNCHYNLKINLNHNTYSDLQINGYA